MTIKQSVETVVKEGAWSIRAHKGEATINCGNGYTAQALYGLSPKDLTNLMMCINQLRLLWKGEETE